MEYATSQFLKTFLMFSRLLFFFSSRRRHTRLQGDWSSDVCSSDLSLPARLVGIEEARRDRRSRRETRGSRSEERRVGKQHREQLVETNIEKDEKKRTWKDNHIHHAQRHID